MTVTQPPRAAPRSLPESRWAGRRWRLAHQAGRLPGGGASPGPGSTPQPSAGVSRVRADGSLRAAGRRARRPSWLAEARMLASRGFARAAAPVSQELGALGLQRRPRLRGNPEAASLHRGLLRGRPGLAGRGPPGRRPSGQRLQGPRCWFPSSQTRSRSAPAWWPPPPRAPDLGGGKAGHYRQPAAPEGKGWGQGFLPCLPVPKAWGSRGHRIPHVLACGAGCDAHPESSDLGG